MFGRVVDGKIEVPDLEEGAAVLIIAEGEDGFVLTPEEEDEIAAALAEVEAGVWIDGETLLRELREMLRRP
jgi:hypothetical protein